MRSPSTAMAPAMQLEKARMQQRRPNTAKNKKINLLKKKNFAQEKNQSRLLALVVNQREEKKNTKAKSVFILILRTCRICHWDCWFSWQGGDGKRK